MKKLQLLLVLLLLSAVSFSQTTLKVFLERQPEVKSVEQMDCTDFFAAKYKIMVEQPVDHSDPAKGTFLQRVLIADKGIDRPVVFITEGYNGGYSENPNYINELCPILEANQICMDHRYFGESMPEPLNYDYLTVRNAAADHHHIIQLMKKYYSGKWISTGISKGGQTTVYHRWLYPNDVDISVPYVAPLNFGVEDGRHEPFIANTTGTPEGRAKVQAFQLQILKNRETYLPLLEQYCKNQHLNPLLNNDELLDYVVLEFSYGFWQYDNSLDDIPALDAPAKDLFAELVKVSSPMYLASEGVDIFKSFYVQAAHELGYYGYDIEPFKEYLSITSAEGWLNRIYLPELAIKYNKKTAKEVKKFIKKTDAKMLFIYGEWDPWSASAFDVPGKPNFLKIVKPEGSHSTRIGNLPKEQKQQVKETLEDWLDMEVNIEI
ncbi:PS-10 peptidase S37 [Draconibacterium orientale]|uniref:PS-10 peptidase S37 n=1 Tax=Draconibacterium orientale TaxID=1168034 RepID=X5D8I0_9BACT|nr:S28 family serine protease [Draconibacterium orientale]AHW59043.1 tripeptidyl aminopeptidase [Draconibacterium orientale]SET60327.1 PS-10 peptidase S37 [Draconibacterium orientale]